MDNAPFTQALNHLRDLSRALEQRYSVNAALARSGPLQALLLLRAAEHGADALRLHEAVVLLRGTPHSDVTEAGRADPLLHDPPAALHGDAALLQSCIEAESLAASSSEAVLALPGLPAPARAAVAQCLQRSRQRERALQEWGPGLSSPGQD